ncbi:MAG: AAA family ATPase [Verrucomicrobia bacterium]|nr:AAA family ATPase [Verrucomicrobiota bacterium]
MISSLSIQNLILIEKSEIKFGQGLNIITGETGSGKSALLSAIRLLLGAKADAQQIRAGAPLAIVEAEIEARHLRGFEEEEIELPSTPIVSIRREIHRSGKSRCFFEESQISLSTLKKIVGSSIELVDQSSSATLCSCDEQRKWLDAFAGILPETASFAQSYEEERTLKLHLEQLLNDREKGERERLRAEEDLAAIEEVDWKEGEEEKLTQEHYLLTNAQELLEKVGSIVALLSESQEPLVPILKRTAHSLEPLLRFDPRLSESYEGMKRSALELEEVSFTLRSYLDRLDTDPNRLTAVETRLAALEKLKKRFGPREEIERLKISLAQRLDRSLGDEIEAAQSKLNTLQEKNRAKASAISRSRKEAAPLFAEKIAAEVRSLNLPQARFEIAVLPKEISSQGIDSVAFLFTANPGYAPLPLEECASGGELSRLLLAIKTTLADKEKSSCLIFDEIDSNVGGQTASILGAKLQTLSQTRQVICVTHFVQVATFATHHFLVSKKDSITTVQKLLKSEREMEFQRMLGQSNYFQKSEKHIG